MTTRHPPTSSLHLQHTLNLRLMDETGTTPEARRWPGPDTTEVASTPCTLTISYHWEATDNGHPTPNSPAWNPIASLKQFWVPVVDDVQITNTHLETDLIDFCPDLIPSEDDPLILSLLSTLSPSDFPLPPLPPPP